MRIGFGPSWETGARALYEYMSSSEIPWEELSDERRRYYMTLAIVVIQAME